MTAVWAPPRVAQIEFGDLDVFEVAVYNTRGTRALVAALELVSPSNKDREPHREAFATRCAAYLQQNVSVIVVDIVTERHANLHEAIAERLHLDEGHRRAAPSDLDAVSYRTAGIGTSTRLEFWPVTLALGQPLPVLPLWIAPSLVRHLDLESTFIETCRGLRIPVAPPASSPPVAPPRP